MYGIDQLKRPMPPIRVLNGTQFNTSAPYGANSDTPEPASPMAATSMAQAPAPRGNPQTFAQMRASGMARPAPPAVSQGTRSAIDANVQNPGAYGAPQAMETFNRLNAALAEQFGVQRRALDGQSARRGIYDSSVAVGQLGDLGVQQARAQSDLAGQIAERAALSNQADRASAIGQSLQLGQMDQNQSQFDMQQELARIMGLGGLDLQNRSLDQQGSQFTAGQTLDRERLAQQGSQFTAGQQLTRDQMLQQLAMYFGLPEGTDLLGYLPDPAQSAPQGGYQSADGGTFTYGQPDRLRGAYL